MIWAVLNFHILGTGDWGRWGYPKGWSSITVSGLDLKKLLVEAGWASCLTLSVRNLENIPLFNSSIHVLLKWFNNARATEYSL